MSISDEHPRLFHMGVPPGRDKLYKVRVSLVLCLEIRVRFSKVPIINGSAKLLLFKCMV